MSNAFWQKKQVLERGKGKREELKLFAEKETCSVTMTTHRILKYICLPFSCSYKYKERQVINCYEFHALRQR